jgi:hypothetical protein
MKQHYPTIGLQRLCRLFGKTRQAYYDHSNRVGSDKMTRELILELVRQTRKQLPRIGILKLHYMLKEELMLHAISTGRDSFCLLLKKNNLQIKRRTTLSIADGGELEFLRPGTTADSSFKSGR